MKKGDEKLQDLTKSAVALESASSGDVLGTGVIVTDDGLILTCYHVIEEFLNNSTNDNNIVNVHFSTEGQIKLHAKVLKEYCNESLDIAFLRLQEPTNQTVVANLGEKVCSTNEFHGYGFRKPTQFDGLHSKGEIQGITHKISDDGTASRPLIQLQSNSVAPGMSGSPILDTKLNQVIGVVSERYRTHDDVDNDLSFGIPVESIIRVCPILKEKNYGLLKITQFLQEIGLEGALYRFLDAVYVPPVEYDDIKDALTRDSIVFIVGTKEYGKTYTALKLLWEYYKTGYQPKYVQTREEEKEVIRHELAGLIEKELSPKNIVYFEDPFGKVKYQSDQDLEEQIGTIIDAVRHSKDSYVIITSREEVFKEFEYKTIPDTLLKFEKNLNIKTPSYDYEKRKEMLLKWARSKGCKWLGDDYLTSLVLNLLKDKKKLSSPLKIRDYAISTVGTITEKELLDIMDARSQDTERSFANEIKEMTQDKILFLMFPFISDGFSETFVKSNYEILVKELNIEKEAWIFSGIIDHFKRDKIDLKNGNVRFSHPSYSEAIKYIIFDNRTTREGEILEIVLLRLASHNHYDYNVAIIRIIVDNFVKMSDEVKKLFIKLAGDANLSWIIQSNFDKLPPEVVDILLDSGYYIANVVNMIASNFDSLSSEKRNELLLNLANKDYEYYNDYSLDSVADFLVSFFYKLPKEVRNKLLVRLHRHDYIPGNLVYFLQSNFDKLSSEVREELLQQLVAYGKYHLANVVNIVISNFDILPSKMREEILSKLASYDPMINDLVSIASNFDILPSKMREEILSKLANNPSFFIVEALANIVMSNFDKLPLEVGKELLFGLADNYYASKYIVNIVISNFDRLPLEAGKELLFGLADKYSASQDIVDILGSLFDKLPVEVVEALLFSLAERYDIIFLAEHITSDYTKLPLKVRNKIYQKLEEQYNYIKAEEGYHAVIDYLESLSEEVRNELLRRVNDIEFLTDVITWYYESPDRWRKPQEGLPVLETRAEEERGKARLEVRGMRLEDRKLPQEVRNKIYQKLEEQYNFFKAEGQDDAMINFYLNNLPEDVRNELLRRVNEKEKARDSS